MAQMTQFYDEGKWGYMGVGPTPSKGFTLTISWYQTVSEGWWTGSGWDKLGILFYNPTDHTRYAVHKTAYITATAPIAESNDRMIVANSSYTQGLVPTSQEVELSYDANNWEFYGGFSHADLAGAAICFFTIEPDEEGTAPNGKANASMSDRQLEGLLFTYELQPERFASTIDGSNIYAKRAECDSDGNPIITTYATKAELAGKQDVLTAGTNINIDSDGVISADLPEEEEVEFEELDLDDYQKKLTEGTGIDLDSDGNISVDPSIATKSYVDTAVKGKANSATTLAGYGITDAYTKTEVDSVLSGKANSATTYTKTEVDTALAGKADEATTLAGYGITDAYTKTEVNTALSGKQGILTGITDVQVVQALPATPVATVLYLIPEV